MYAYLLVGFNFQWLGRSTEWIGRGLAGLSLKPPLLDKPQSEEVDFKTHFGF